MRTLFKRKSLVFWASVVATGLAGIATAQAQGDDAARALAERFASPPVKTAPAPPSVRVKEHARKPSSDRVVAQAPSAEEQRLLEEIDMLVRARAEAESRREALIQGGADPGVAVATPGKPSGASGNDGSQQMEDAKARQREVDRLAEEARQLAEKQRLAEEAKRAAQAQREASDAKRLAEEQRRIEESKRQAQVQRESEQAKQLAEEQRGADAAKRAAQAQREAEQAKLLAEQQRQADELKRVAEERRRVEDEKRAAEAKAQAEAKRLADLAAEREAEADRIAETLKAARAARQAEQRPVDQPVPVARRSSDEQVGRENAGDRGRPDFAERSSPRRFTEGDRRSTRVTVLIRMTPGDYGIRRNNKSADPLLCTEEGCFVSEGTADAARLMPRRRALGVRRTLGSRAGACNNSLGCVFRGIELGSYPAIVQPVDMHVIRHDKRQPQALHETSDCRVSGRQLICAGAFQGPDYIMWVVPEALAEAAGGDALQRAVDEGLGSEPGARFEARR